MKSVRGALRVGVFGGSFDPPHVGHVLFPALLRARDLVDLVVVAPCADHPLGKSMSPFADRLTWTRLAMEPYGAFVDVTGLERELAIAHPGPSYTLRLLEAVAARRPDAEVRLIIGSDIIHTGETDRWHRWDRIEAEFDPIIVPRAGYADPEACVLPDASSSDVRAAIAAGRWEEVAQRVPAAVVERLRRPAQGVVWIVGHGHVATHAEPWLRARGYDVEVVSGRDPVPPETEPICVWVLVRDPAIPSVANALVGQLPPGVPVLHGAGARPAADVLAPLKDSGHPVGTLHPICSLRRERPWPPQLPRAAFGIEGDPAARALAEAFVGDQVHLCLQGFDADQRRAYHAACSLAANHLSVLEAGAADVLIAQGHDPPNVAAALSTLIASAFENLRALGMPAGLTGPVARGDQATVDAHLQALDPKTAELYRLLSARLGELVAATAPKP